MKKLALSLVLAVAAPAAFAQWVQNDLINVAGGGTGAAAGGDLSQLETSPVAENIFGFGSAASAQVVVADDFTVSGGGWNVTALRFYLYQTGATAPSITGINWAIGSSATLTLNAASPTSVNWWNPNGVGVYRMTSTTTSDTNRRIQEVVVDIPDMMLADGTYMLSYSTAGTLASGPWVPPLPTSNAVFGQNAVQSLTGGAFAPVFVDAAGTVGGDLSFVVEATPVPEPATMIALGLGAAAMLRRRAKK